MKKSKLFVLAVLLCGFLILNEENYGQQECLMQGQLCGIPYGLCCPSLVCSSDNMPAGTYGPCRVPEPD